MCAGYTQTLWVLDKGPKKPQSVIYPLGAWTQYLWMPRDDCFSLHVERTSPVKWSWPVSAPHSLWPWGRRSDIIWLMAWKDKLGFHAPPSSSCPPGSRSKRTCAPDYSKPCGKPNRNDPSFIGDWCSCDSLGGLSDSGIWDYESLSCTDIRHILKNQCYGWLKKMFQQPPAHSSFVAKLT